MGKGSRGGHLRNGTRHDHVNSREGSGSAHGEDGKDRVQVCGSQREDEVF